MFVNKMITYPKRKIQKVLRKRKERALNLKVSRALMEVSPKRIVLNGPFQGMKYPTECSVGSEYAPKIIGSYENELEEVIEEICKKQYSEIVDIGCAEGYYAVGLALRVPTAKVYAYDTNTEALCLCKKMAELNEVEDRVFYGGFCDSSTLKDVHCAQNSLIVCDCEGYEKILFNEELSPYLESHDLLIETHDFLDSNISSYIKKIFCKTHNVKSIFSIDDRNKPHNYLYPEVDDYDLEVKAAFFAECRPSKMEWLYLTPMT